MTNSVLRIAAGALFRATNQISEEVKVDDVIDCLESLEVKGQQDSSGSSTAPWKIEQPSEKQQEFKDDEEDDDDDDGKGRDDLTMASCASDSTAAAMSLSTTACSSSSANSFGVNMRRISSTGLSAVNEEMNEGHDQGDAAAAGDKGEMANQQGKLAIISLDEVALHCYPQDAWMVIYDKVYDVTEFLHEHPGGFDIMNEYIGYDASLAFRSVGHSEDAVTMLEDYLIGELPENERMYLKTGGESDDTAIQFAW